MHFGLFEGDVNGHIIEIARSVADVFDLTSRVSGPHFAGDVNDCRGFHIDWRHEVMSSF